MKYSGRSPAIRERSMLNKNALSRGAVSFLVILVVVCQLGCLFQKSQGQGTFLLTLQTKSDQPVTAVMGAIRKRASVLGASKDDVVQLDSKTVAIRLPGYHDDIKKAVRIMGSRGMLEFRLVDKKAGVAAAESGGIPQGDELLYQSDLNRKTGKISQIGYVVKEQTLMTGDELVSVRVQADAKKQGGILIVLDFNRPGAKELERITGEHVGERLAIILDNRVYSAPVITDRISQGSAIIGGNFGPEEAHELALLLMNPYCSAMEVVKSEWVRLPSGKQ